MVVVAENERDDEEAKFGNVWEYMLLLFTSSAEFVLVAHHPPSIICPFSLISSPTRRRRILACPLNHLSKFSQDFPHLTYFFMIARRRNRGLPYY